MPFPLHLLTSQQINTRFGILRVNDQIDAKDKVNHWYTAIIEDIRDTYLLVSFDGWSSKFNEWIDIHSDRYALYGTYSTGLPALNRSPPVLHTVETAIGLLHVRDRIDAQDRVGIWYNATVVTIETDRFLVHFDGWENEQNEWILINSDQYAPFNTCAGNTFVCSDCVTRHVIVGIPAVNDRIDAQDKLGKWYPSTVVAVRGSSILVSFDEWESQFDEWIDLHSDRYAALGTMAETVPSTPVKLTPSTPLLANCRIGYLKPGDLIDAEDKMGFWHHATVIEVTETQIYVKFAGWDDSTFNEWIPLDSRRYANYGSRITRGLEEDVQCPCL